MAYVAFLLSAATVFLAAVGFRLYRTPSLLKEKMDMYSAPTVSAAAGGGYYQRRLRPLAQKLGARLQRLQRYLQPGDWESRLVWAGNPGGLRTTEELLGLQVLLGLGAMILIAPLVKDAVTLALLPVAGLLGLAFPLIWLDSRATERQRQVNRAVPDALDILTICVQAGLGFDSALRQIVQRTSGPLSEELGRFLRELEIGVPREECFGRLLARTNSEELRILVGALVQAQQLGVPIAQTLEEQAADMRVRRIQRAREEGAKASPKIALITTIMIAPAVMCIFLAIVLYSMAGQFIPLLRGAFQ